MPSSVDYAVGTGADDDAVAAFKVKLLVSDLKPHHGCLVGLVVWCPAERQEDLDRADAAARELEAAAGGSPVDLERDMDKLQGRDVTLNYQFKATNSSHESL
uniref:Uncharacterized protein n=1 Tax=Oryza nivara TaxID=4536 RepID=A0A0E0IAX7_ORYNI